MQTSSQEATEKGTQSVFSRALLAELDSILRAQFSPEQLRGLHVQDIGLQLAAFVALKEKVIYKGGKYDK